MDKITAQTLRELEKLEKDLQKCQARLQQIGRARVPVYFGVSTKAQNRFTILYSALHDIQHILQNHPEKIEG